jgi:hypothetical protein
LEPELSAHNVYYLFYSLASHLFLITTASIMVLPIF